MWNLASFRLEAVLVLVQDSARVVPNVLEAHKSFWTHSMVPLGDELKWKLVLVLSDIVLILTQDRSTVCVEGTISS